MHRGRVVEKSEAQKALDIGIEIVNQFAALE